MMRVLGNHRVYFISALTSLIRPRHWVSRWIAAMARSSDTVRLKAVHASPWSLVGMPGRSGEELLWLVIQAAGVGIFETDLKLRRMRFSPELCELLGLPVGQKWQSRKRWGFSMNATGRGCEPAPKLPSMPPTKDAGAESIACGARTARSDGCLFAGRGFTG